MSSVCLAVYQAKAKFCDYMFNLYFIETCRYMCKLRALSRKHGVLQGFNTLQLHEVAMVTPIITEFRYHSGEKKVLRPISHGCSVRILLSQPSFLSPPAPNTEIRG